MDAKKNLNQKLISVPPELVKIAKAKTKKMGINFSEYVRMLIIRDNWDKFEDVEILDEEASKGVEQGIRDIKEGRYTSVKTKEELEKFLNEL